MDDQNQEPEVKHDRVYKTVTDIKFMLGVIGASFLACVITIIVSYV